jgi:hypothetical protein
VKGSDVVDISFWLEELSGRRRRWSLGVAVNGRRETWLFGPMSQLAAAEALLGLLGEMTWEELVPFLRRGGLVEFLRACSPGCGRPALPGPRGRRDRGSSSSLSRLPGPSDK